MSKYFLAAFLVIALCFSLCGCTYSPNSSEPEVDFALPEPSPHAPRTIQGEQIASKPKSVALHYVSGDGSSFSTITRSLIVSPGESIYEEAVDTLLHSAASPERMAFIPPEIQVIDADHACGIVTVQLSLDAYNIQSEQEYLMLLASISNTLLSMDGVRAVNILVGDQCQSIASLPVGVLTQPLSGITPTYAQYNAERDYFLNSETGTIVRNAILYFPTEIGDYFVPELREITFDSSDYASALIRALRSGPLEYSCAISAVPENADLLMENPKIWITSDGERVAEFNFSPTLRNYLAFSGIEEWELAGSIALTVCSFAPELDAVRICIDGEAIQACTIGESELSFENGRIRRSDFEPFVGSAMTLYLPQADGTLKAVERAVSAATAESPLGLLCELFDDVLTGSQKHEVFPVDVYCDDILGVSLEDGVVSVNLSGNFYRQAQALEDADERSIIYSMVNTLCELEGITGVRFYVEGISAETLSGGIYLGSVLMPNPGASGAERTVPENITATQ